MEWSIQQIARIAGTTSRTLRHYDAIGLVRPSRVGANGYRYYDEHALVRLQRVLLLRELGLGLAQIAQVIEQEADELAALKEHLALLEQEQSRLTRKIAAVEHTITSLTRQETPMAEHMFDGFDHAQYREEVEARWGAAAYAQADAWWRSRSREDQTDFLTQLEALNHDWVVAAADPDITADSPRARELAERHIAWLRGIPGTPAATPDGDLRGYVHGLAEMYVSDERFAANYGGVEGAKFVRDALRSYLP